MLRRVAAYYLWKLLGCGLAEFISCNEQMRRGQRVVALFLINRIKKKKKTFKTFGSEERPIHL